MGAYAVGRDHVVCDVAEEAAESRVDGAAVGGRVED